MTKDQSNSVPENQARETVHHGNSEIMGQDGLRAGQKS
jgi:hypothetical protein